MTAEPLLALDRLTVRHGGVTAVDHVSFGVDAGSVVGLIGPNGAGKTSCIDAVTGFVAADGEVVFEGRRLTDQPPHRRARAGLARTFQSLELFDDLTVRANLAVVERVPSWRSALVDLARPRGSRGAPVTDEVLGALGLDEVADRLPSELSNGTRHLVALARALVARPRLVLLDEPAAGLDPAETEELGRRLRSLPDLGVTVLVVDHDMGLIMGTCDVVHVLDVGRLIASGPPVEVQAHPAVLAAYLGSGTP